MYTYIHICIQYIFRKHMGSNKPAIFVLRCEMEVVAGETRSAQPCWHQTPSTSALWVLPLTLEIKPLCKAVGEMK